MCLPKMTAKSNGQTVKPKPDLVTQFGWCEWGIIFNANTTQPSLIENGKFH